MVILDTGHSSGNTLPGSRMALQVSVAAFEPSSVLASGWLVVRRRQANSSRLLCRQLHLVVTGLPIPTITLFLV